MKIYGNVYKLCQKYRNPFCGRSVIEEDVILHLVRSICLPVLLYGLEVCQLSTSNLSKAHVTRNSSGPATLAISVDLQQ